MTIVRQVVPGTRRYTRHTIYELAESIRERDYLTYAHCRRVAIYVTRLARALGIPRRGARDFALAALVHDLGKTWMQNSILHKDSALSSDEWQDMLRHPAIGARILIAYDVPDEYVQIVLHHHECFDGRGYPGHLAGDDIPFGARILTVGDVFDALTTARPYKSAMPAATVCERMRAECGTHFDPRVAAAFTHMVESRQGFVLPANLEPLVMPEAQRAWAKHDFLAE